jgi:hypothetical protein
MQLKAFKILGLEEEALFRVGSETRSGTFRKSDPDPKLIEKSGPDP